MAFGLKALVSITCASERPALCALSLLAGLLANLLLHCSPLMGFVVMQVLVTLRRANHMVRLGGLRW